LEENELIRIALRLFYLESFTKISLALNIFLALALISSGLELHKAALSLDAKNRISIENSIFSKSSILETKSSNANNFQLEEFLGIYLDKLFSLNEINYDDSFKWLKENTELSFFDEYLTIELEKRYKNGLESGFQIDKIYSENLENHLIKVICYGAEIDKSLESKDEAKTRLLRKLIIELVINTDSQKITEILNIKEN